jgi:hypothetical protein
MRVLNVLVFFVFIALGTASPAAAEETMSLGPGDLQLLAMPVAIATADPDATASSATTSPEDLDAIRAGSWRGELGIAFQAGFPQGDFDFETSFGAAVFGGVGLPNLPVVLGADFGFLIGDGDRKTLAESAVSSVVAAASSDIAMLHFVARLQAATGRFRPFVDAVIGFKHFETRTTVNEHFDNFGDPDDCIFTNCVRPIDNKKNSSDVALSYGVGAGLDVRIYAIPAVRVSVVVGARYLFGEKAKYVIPSSIRIIDGDTVEFETARSRTDLLTTQLGFSVQF